MKKVLKKSNTLYSRLYRNIDFRVHPELYPIGKGEQGVLLAQPYKSEILPLWRFKTPEIARESAESIYQKFLDYQEKKDFVGMDMARKFIQMGVTRSRRYANHASGKKWNDDRTAVLPLVVDEQKAESARIFYEYYQKIMHDEMYTILKDAHKKLYKTVK